MLWCRTWRRVAWETMGWERGTGLAAAVCMAATLMTMTTTVCLLDSALAVPRLDSHRSCRGLCEVAPSLTRTQVRLHPCGAASPATIAEGWCSSVEEGGTWEDGRGLTQSRVVLSVCGSARSWGNRAAPRHRCADLGSRLWLPARGTPSSRI